MGIISISFRGIMKKLILMMLLLAVNASGQITATITDNNFSGPMGTHGTWQATITPSTSFISSDGYTIPGGMQQKFTITGSSFSVNVVPTLVANPPNAFYTVNYQQTVGGTGGFSENWCVGPVNTYNRASVICNGNTTNMLYQTLPPGSIVAGYQSSAGSGLNVNISAGFNLLLGSTLVTYSGGSLSLTASTTNYMYLAASTYVPTVSTTTFTSGQIPIATVTTGTSSITSLTDQRPWTVNNTNNVSKVIDAGGQYYNVQAYNVTGNGITDVTAAIQLLINNIVGTDGSNCGGSNSVTIFFPVGIYLISSPLVLPGSPGCSIHIMGAAPRPGIIAGSVIKWNGSSGVPMLLTWNLNSYEIDHLTFDTEKTANAGIWLVENSDTNGTLSQNITTTGSQTVTVGSTGNMAAGYWLRVDSGASFEMVLVTAVGSGNITASFSKLHSSGATIGGSSSSGGNIHHISTINLSGSGSDGIKIGNVVSNTWGCGQTSEIYIDHNLFYGADGTAHSGIYGICAGSTKNVWIDYNDFSYLVYGAYLNGTGGGISFKGDDFSQIQKADIWAQQAPVLVENCESESVNTTTHIFVANGGSGSAQGTLTLINNSWQATPPSAPTDCGTGPMVGSVICWAGQLVMIGNQFGATGTQQAYIQEEYYDSAPATLRIVSLGNQYYKAPAGYIPVATYNGTALLPYYLMSFSVTSLGDEGGTPASPVAMTDFIGQQTQIVSSSIVSGGAAATLTGTGACATASLSSQAGGSWSGQVNCGGTTGASTLTISPGTTVPNSWMCFGTDVTAKVSGVQSTWSTTSCTLTFSSVTSGDGLMFSLFGH
jgi:hypothetical protein